MTTTNLPSTPERLNQVFEQIDTVNAKDPNTTEIEGISIPNELLYGQRMSDTLSSLAPDAGELLQIAVRAQHIERWVLPRSDYPDGRTGYKKWRSQLALHHADRTTELMDACNYSEAEIERVKYLLLKRGLKRDDETQHLEDTACVVFLKYYFEEFARKHTEEKLINIVRLTWGKMSNSGHQAALKLPFSPAQKALLEKALS